MPYTPCDALPDHTANLCDSGELGRIRSVAIIANDFTFSDPTNPTEWTDGEAAGKIIILPETSGTYDGGKPKEGPGYGDAENTYMSMEHTVKFKDPTFKDNILFYNTLRKSRGYRMAFRTNSLVHIVESPVNFRPTNPVAEGTDTTVVWDIEAKWTSPDTPLAYDLPTGIFDAVA